MWGDCGERKGVGEVGGVGGLDTVVTAKFGFFLHMLQVIRISSSFTPRIKGSHLGL